MLERLLEFEREWFLAINGAHTRWLDSVMYAFGSVWAWFPLILVPVYFVFKRRNEWLPMLVCTFLTGILNGIATSLIIKPMFKRFRPTHHPLFMDDVRIIDHYIAGGDYGFISGHSTNAFAFAVFSALAVKNRWYSLAIFVWAVTMMYSRLYLSAHFITDVIPGMMLGSFIGWLLYLLFNYMQHKNIFRSSALLLFFAFCCQGGICQKDTLPAPAMTSNRLITLDDYRPDAAYGASCMEMMELQQKPGKSLFHRQGSQFILPTLFIAYGTAARFNQLPVRRFDFDMDHEIRKRVNRHYRIDDYFEYGMPVVAYGLGFIPGIDARHNFRDRTLIMATSLAVMKGSVELLKRTTPVMRPGLGDNRSFPSGHTAVTMLSAHILYKEYRDISPWIGVGGYLVATTTGVFRMLNYAHWLSDVVMGAGIGLLSAEIGYLMLPVWHTIFGIKDAGKQFAAVPAFSTQSLGVCLVYQF